MCRDSLPNKLLFYPKALVTGVIASFPTRSAKETNTRRNKKNENISKMKVTNRPFSSQVTDRWQVQEARNDLKHYLSRRFVMTFHSMVGFVRRKTITARSDEKCITHVPLLYFVS